MNSFQLVVNWLVALMISKASLDSPHFSAKEIADHPDIVETSEQMLHRYNDIALAVTNVVYDPNYAPFNSGNEARAQDAVYALSIANLESSGYLKNVDLGYRLGDHGKSFCLMQVWFDNSKLHRTRQGWSGEDLVKDRQKCFAVGLAKIKESWTICHKYKRDNWLAGYTSGQCLLDPRQKSKHRMEAAQNWIKANPLEVNDVDVFEEKD